MNYFVNDTARRNRPHHLPQVLPQHSDFHDEHYELMNPPPAPPVDATSPDAGWFNEELAS